MARNLVNIEEVSKAFDIRALLERVSLGVSEGDRIGIVGRNGSGKSTLMKVIAAIESPDQGRVTKANSVKIGLLSQVDKADPNSTVGDVVIGDRAKHEWASDSGIREVFTGLFGGFDDHLFERKFSTLSGGEKRRVGLAKLLIDELDLILLDEPTNHLDVEGVAWLATHLNSRKSLAVLVITHDRWFLDAVTDRTWEVVGGKVEEYDGGYSAFVLAKAERARQASAMDARRNNLIRKELAWLRRGAPARTTKPKFRVDAANVLIAEEPAPADVQNATTEPRMAFDNPLADARVKRAVRLPDDVCAVEPCELVERIGCRGQRPRVDFSVDRKNVRDRPPLALIDGVEHRVVQAERNERLKVASGADALLKPVLTVK